MFFNESHVYLMGSANLVPSMVPKRIMQILANSLLCRDDKRDKKQKSLFLLVYRFRCTWLARAQYFLYSPSISSAN